MGCADKKTETSSSFDQTQQTTFAPPSQQEQELLGQFGVLGTAQQDALLQRIRALTSGRSAFELSPQDQAVLDQQFASAQRQLDLSNRDYADYLSGGRGMRMSDTPISQQALARQALGQAELLSQKANTSLNLGLAGNQYATSAALGLAGALPSGSVARFNPMFQERLAGGVTRTTGTGRNTQVYKPSLMDSIQQGVGIGSSLGSLGTAMMGAPTMPGGAGATTFSMGPLTGFKQGGYDFLVNTPGR